MKGPFVLSVASPAATPAGSTTVLADGTPIQRFLKSVIPVGRFIKRDPVTKKILWELDVTPERQDSWVETFKAMKTAGVSVRLMDETGMLAATSGRMLTPGNFTIESPKATLSRNHAGAFDAPSKRLENLAENVVGETIDMFRDPADGWLKTIHEVRGKESIDLVTRAKFTSPEIEACYIDGTDKKYGEAITVISVVARPLIPGQSEFLPIAASEDAPQRHVLTLESEESPMISKSMLASISVLALAAGIKTPVTEANAEQTLLTLQSPVIKALSADDPGRQKIKCSVCGDERECVPLCPGCSMKTRTMSADGPEATGLGLSARLMEKVVEETFRPLVSDVGLSAVKNIIIGDRTKKQYSAFVLSHEDPESALNSIEALCEVIRKNPAVKKGAQTTMQQTHVLSVDDPHAGVTNAPLSSERLKELLNMTPVGREVVETARR